MVLPTDSTNSTASPSSEYRVNIFGVIVVSILIVITYQQQRHEILGKDPQSRADPEVHNAEDARVSF